MKKSFVRLTVSRDKVIAGRSRLGPFDARRPWTSAIVLNRPRYFGKQNIYAVRSGPLFVEIIFQTELIDYFRPEESIVRNIINGSGFDARRFAEATDSATGFCSTDGN